MNKGYPLIKRSLLGYKQYFIDAETRIERGFHFMELGISYHLQRKGIFGWYTTAWTYPSTHEGESLNAVIGYLTWYEKRYHRKNSTVKHF